MAVREDYRVVFLGLWVRCLVSAPSVIIGVELPVPDTLVHVVLRLPGLCFYPFLHTVVYFLVATAASEPRISTAVEVLRHSERWVVRRSTPH